MNNFQKLISNFKYFFKRESDSLRYIKTDMSMINDKQKLYFQNIKF